MMTRKHAEALAKAIREAREDFAQVSTTDTEDLIEAVIENLQERVFAVLIDSNPRMDHQRFTEACQNGN